MPNDNVLGRKLLHAAAEGVLIALEQIPVVGGLIKWGDRCHKAVARIEAEQTQGRTGSGIAAQKELLSW